MNYPYIMKITFGDGYEILAFSDEKIMYEANKTIQQLKNESYDGEFLIDKILIIYADAVKVITDEVFEVNCEDLDLYRF